MRNIDLTLSRQQPSTRFFGGWGSLLSNLNEARDKSQLSFGIALMRSSGVILACFVSLLFLSGCQTQDDLYLRQGPGMDLFSSSLPEATRLQDAYVTYICDQAGLGPSVPGPLGCDASAFGPAQWTIFVQSGMNDIDQRCDSYLAWLDDRKRWATPALQQISDIRTATEAIMVATGASGPYPIGIVGAAFGLATRTFTNINSRLVLELNHSTVQSIVLNRQKQYRIKLLGDLGQRPPVPPILIESRPAAIHALRSYLRLCMPFTIETEVNTTITDIERTGVLPAPLITPETVRSAVIVDVQKPLPTDPGLGRGPGQGGGGGSATSAEIFKVQVSKALCTAQTGQTYEVAVRDFFVGQELVPDNAPLPITKIKDHNVTQMLKNVIAGVGDCAKKNLRNAFEVGRFGVTSDNPKALAEANISDFQSLLQKKLGSKFSGFKNGVLDQTTRTAIANFRKDNNLDVSLGEQIDRKLLNAVTSTNAAVGAGSGSGAPGAGSAPASSAGNGSGAATAPGTANGAGSAPGSGTGTAK